MYDFYLSLAPTNVIFPTHYLHATSFHPISRAIGLTLTYGLSV